MVQLVGSSKPIQQLKKIINQVADTGLSVLITGESGVGKEVIARSLHEASPRAKKAFVKVNCAALPSELLESELFGYEKGAFTGATKSKPGKFELADGGTIFLDEIGDMSIGLQAKLLQVLQDSEFCRVGGIKDKKVDVWVICATNQDLESAIQKGSFREDLFYRINIIQIEVPPLRERRDDIPLLVDYFLNKYSVALNRDISTIRISDDVMKLFQEYHWPGNVRELENYIQKIIVLGDDAQVISELQRKRQLRTRADEASPTQRQVSSQRRLGEDLIDSLVGNIKIDMDAPFPSLKEVKKIAQAKVEKVYIEEALRRTHGNRREAAKLLRISYKALLYKMRDYNVDLKNEFLGNGITVSLPEEN